MKFSQIVGCNILPLIDFWNIPFPSDCETNEKICTLPKWLPDDNVTKYCLDRTKSIREKYGSNLLIGNEILNHFV